MVVHRHQLHTAEKVIEEMNGRAILADEVGLGKTIEAGLIVCELMERGQARNILILTPTSLMRQWAAELLAKFGLSFSVNPSTGWERLPLIIASIDLVKREPRRSQVVSRPWDLVIVDEAHRLKNRRTLNYQLVRDLRAERILLLSATPLQNDLTELYSLVSLVQPGLFGSFNEFWRQFLIDKRTPKDPEEMRRILARVMIRHRRHDLSLSLPERQVALLPLKLFPEERLLYERLTAALRREYQSGRYTANGSILPLITLQRAVCSSSRAVAVTLSRLSSMSADAAPAFQELLQLATSIKENRKAYTLVGLVQELNEKIIVFTEFRSTQDYIVEELAKAGIKAIKFHGNLSASEREQVIERFRRNYQVLVSTECGGQGLNLQFCRNIVNYDLPWNPMRVEQRIGRVHRLGQTADRVNIFNMCAEGTIEEYILRLLDEKINLFRQVIGELDIILRHLERRRGVETRIAGIALSSKDDEEMRRQFEYFGNELRSYARLASRTTAALPT